MNEKVPIGKLAEPKAGRDAIHVAVAPCVAFADLEPGEHVGLIPLPGNTEIVGVAPNPIGIVDPFLTATIRKGERFYLCLYPDTVTGLRHVWTHPAFPGAGT